MAKPWKPFVVAAGDHLDQIAFRLGTTPDEIWNKPDNADLKARRKDRNMLCAGDVVMVPSEPVEGLSFSVGTSNSFKAAVPKVKVQLRLRGDEKKGNGDGKNATYGNQPFVVDGAMGDGPLEGTSEADGTVKFEVSVLVREVMLRLPKLGMRIPIAIGGLDPIDEPSGVAQRLQHLGFLPNGSPTPAALTHAIRTFKARNGLPVDAAMDDATREAMVKAHGS